MAMRPSSRARLKPALVVLAREVQQLGVGELRRVAVGRADAQRHQRTGGQMHTAHLRVFHRAAVAELVRRFEAQEFVDRAGEHRLLRSRVGSCLLQRGIQKLASLRVFLQCDQTVADEVGGGLVPGVEQEDAVLQQLHFTELFATCLTLDQSREHIALRVAGMLAALHHQAAQVGQHVGHGLVAEGLLLWRERGLQSAQDGQRPVAQRAAVCVRHIQQVADDLHRNGRGEVFDEVAAAALGQGIQQAVDQCNEARLHVGDGPARERAHVEHQAGGVVLEQRGAHAVLGRELDLFVGAEGLRVAVHRHQIGAAREEHRAVGHAAHGLVLAQGRVHRVGVGEKLGLQRTKVEGPGDFLCPCGCHQGCDVVVCHVQNRSAAA